MLYWKYSDVRTFILNEYWIFIPPAILANYLAIRYIRGRKKRIRELKELKKQIEDLQKMMRVACLATCSNEVSQLSQILVRGGADFIDVSHIDCGIEEGLNFLDKGRLRKIIHGLYSHKRKVKIIYITATVLFHLANRYGHLFLGLPITIGNFGLTSLSETVRKLIVTFLFGAVAPLFVIGGTPAILFAIVAGVGGWKLAFINLDFIGTTLIPATVSAENLKPRIPDLPDVVVINNRNKIVMTNPIKEKGECWLADQALLNSNCEIKPTDIPDAINLVAPKYDDVVNMQEVTGLSHVKLSDTLNLGQAKPSDVPNIMKAKRGKAKLVNFLDKFGDPDFVDEKCKWDTSEPIVSEIEYLRVTNKDKP